MSVSVSEPRVMEGPSDGDPAGDLCGSFFSEHLKLTKQLLQQQGELRKTPHVKTYKDNKLSQACMSRDVLWSPMNVKPGPRSVCCVILTLMLIVTPGW